MRGNDSKSGAGGDPDTPPLDPTTNERTRYYHPGDPVVGTGWLDTNPADRRYMCNTGPFTFNPDDTQVVVGAVLVGQGRDRLSSVKALKFYDILAQYAYDVNFDIPAPPPRPIVQARAYDRKVVLTWGNRSETEYDIETHDFEGYVVYQGETVAGPWQPIAYFDIKNGYGQLSDFVLNPDIGDIALLPTVYGTDTDLGYGMEIEQDYILGGPLHNGKTYYFGVTAYSYDFEDYLLYLQDPGRPEEDYTIPKGFWYLENSVLAYEVTPMDPLAGDDWDYSQEETPATATISRVDPNLPPATDVVSIYVIDPDSVTGNDYEVRFTPVYPETINSVPVYPDTTDDGQFLLYQNGIIDSVSFFWELWDVTAEPDVRLLDRQWNKTGNDDYRVVNGLQVIVTGQHNPQFQDAVYVDNNSAHSGRALSWVGWGGAFFSGAVDYGYNFWGGYYDPVTYVDSFGTVEIRFTDELDGSTYLGQDGVHGQRAYNYLRPGYAYQGYFRVPFEAWDVRDPDNPRQVNVAFVESVDSDVYDSTWAPDESDLGGREYLLLLNSDYDGDDPADAGTGSIDYTTEDFGDGSAFDFTYGAWLRHRPGGNVIDSGDVFAYIFANPADDNDVYQFTTVPPLRDDVALGSAALEDIRVVPNPYYAYSIYESDQFDRQVRFLGLPDEFTIRIFNIAGDMVRVLDSDEKNPGQSWMAWNLLTDQGLPVASGIYVWYLESPLFGTKYGKMAVFQEIEQLDTY